MRVLRGDSAAWDAGGPHAVTIGVFDGVHRGHRHVIARAAEAAGRAGLRTGLITFDRHPLTVLAPEHAPLLLTSLDRRLELFEELGLDTVGVLPFDDTVRSSSPEDFVVRVIVMGFGARWVVVGEDFRFGRDRAGNVEVLATVGIEMGFDVEAVPLVADGGLLSSSRIRELVAAGDVEAAAAALGRPFEVTGIPLASGPGGEGHIGIPDGMAVPGPGAYAVRSVAEGSEGPPGVACPAAGPDGDVRVIFRLLGDVPPVDRLHLSFVARLADAPQAGRTPTPGELEESRRLFERGS